MYAQPLAFLPGLMEMRYPPVSWWLSAYRKQDMPLEPHQGTMKHSGGTLWPLMAGEQ